MRKVFVAVAVLSFVAMVFFVATAISHQAEVNRALGRMDRELVKMEVIAKKQPKAKTNPEFEKAQSEFEFFTDYAREEKDNRNLGVGLGVFSLLVSIGSIVLFLRSGDRKTPASGLGAGNSSQVTEAGSPS